MSVAQMLKRLRKECKLTQKELAQKTGLSLSAIIAYENGLREPNSKAMTVLERYFEVSGSYLRGELDSDTFFDEVNKVGNSLDVLADIISDFQSDFKYTTQEKQMLSVDIAIETFKFLIKYILPEDNKNTISSDEVNKLLSQFILLNNLGKEELLKRLEELTQLVKYTK